VGGMRVAYLWSFSPRLHYDQYAAASIRAASSIYQHSIMATQ